MVPRQTTQHAVLQIQTDACRSKAAAGSRVLSVQVDGTIVGSGIDIFKDQGFNVAVAFHIKAVAASSRMTVTVTASVCHTMLQAKWMFQHAI